MSEIPPGLVRLLLLYSSTLLLLLLRLLLLGVLSIQVESSEAYSSRLMKAQFSSFLTHLLLVLCVHPFPPSPSFIFYSVATAKAEERKRSVGRPIESPLE